MANPLEAVNVSEAIRRLSLYNDKVLETRALSFKDKVLIANHGVILHFTFEPEFAMSFDKRGSTREATTALAAVLRLFLQPRDKISLWHISALYERLPVPPEDLRAVRTAIGEVDSYLDESISDIISASMAS